MSLNAPISKGKEMGGGPGPGVTRTLAQGQSIVSLRIGIVPEAVVMALLCWGSPILVVISGCVCSVGDLPLYGLG